MDGQDNRQTQHEQVTSHLHQTIHAEGTAAMGRDEQLGQELLDTEAQHQRPIQNHERILNGMKAELEANREARETQESHRAELTEAVTSLICQVKGKRLNSTRKRSAGAGGGGGGRPPPTMDGAVRGTTNPGDTAGEGSDDERRGRWDERPTNERSSLQKRKN